MTDNNYPNPIKVNKEGNSHWILHKITAILLIPLSIVLLCFILKLILYPQQKLQLLQSWYYIPMMIMFFWIVLLHATLGIESIVDDYIHCNCLKKIIIYTVKIVNIFSLVLVTMSAIRLYVVAVI